MKKKDYKVPMQDLGIKTLPTPDEVFDWFHKQGRYLKTERNDDYDGSAEGSLAITKNTSVEYAIPEHEPIEHGPVKEYTPEEIAEYEESRND